MIGPEGISGGEQVDERLLNPDEYFSSKYGHEIVQYGGFPPMTLGGALEAERKMRGPQVVDEANQTRPDERAARHVQLLVDARALREEDRDLADKFGIEVEY